MQDSKFYTRKLFLEKIFNMKSSEILLKMPFSIILGLNVSPYQSTTILQAQIGFHIKLLFLDYIPNFCLGRCEWKFSCTSKSKLLWWQYKEKCSFWNEFLSLRSSSSSTYVLSQSLCGTLSSCQQRLGQGRWWSRWCTLWRNMMAPLN